MKIIKQSAHIVKEWSKMNLYERCEFAGRISHASEDKIKEGSAEEFVQRMVKLGHESVFEFARIKFYESHAGTNLRQVRQWVKNNKNLGYAKAIYKKYPSFFIDCDNPNFIYYESRFNFHNDNLEIANDWIPVVIITNRAISHQLVRYRKDVVYLQSSQRYIKYGDVEFIDPEVYFPEIPREEYYKGGNNTKELMRRAWMQAMEDAEQDYIHCLSEGYPAQAARLFLPNSAATKLIMYASLDTWRHVFEQRISDKADPMIRELLEPLREEFIREGLA